VQHGSRGFYEVQVDLPKQYLEQKHRSADSADVNTKAGYGPVPVPLTTLIRIF
jgi:hypothetical protein